MARSAVFLCLFALVSTSCSRRPAEPRTLGILVLADQDFRARPNWEPRLRERLRKAGEAFSREFNINWQIRGVDSWETRKGVSAPLLRHGLGGASNPYLSIGVSGQSDPANPLGFAYPFSRILTVYDAPQRSEDENTAILAHQVALVFGAWTSPQKDSVMNEQPSSLRFDDNANQMIRLTRTVDFERGIGSLDQKTIDKISQLYAGTKGAARENPMFRAYAGRGADFLAGSNPDAALNEFRKAEKIYNDDMRVHYLAGLALRMLRDPEGSITEFREVVRLDAKSPVAHWNLGLALAERRHYDEAIKSLRQSLALKSDSAEAHYVLGGVLARRGQTDEATAELREALRLKPESPAFQRAVEQISKRQSPAIDPNAK